MDILYPSGPNGLAVFVFVTLILGGAASWAAGRAVAMVWKPIWQLAFYMALMTFAVRFVQYALFHQPFLTVGNVLVDYLALSAFAMLGYRMMRTWQMGTQYPWLFTQGSIISWQRKD